jgi:hypothetical protein
VSAALRLELSHVEQDARGRYGVLRVIQGGRQVAVMKDGGRYQTEGGARVAAYRTIREWAEKQAGMGGSFGQETTGYGGM